MQQTQHRLSRQLILYIRQGLLGCFCVFSALVTGCDMPQLVTGCDMPKGANTYFWVMGVQGGSKEVATECRQRLQTLRGLANMNV